MIISILIAIILLLLYCLVWQGHQHYMEESKHMNRIEELKQELENYKRGLK